MNKKDHLLIGCLSGILTHTILAKAFGAKPTPDGIMISALIGGIGGIVPDLLEPAVSPNHRSFFHSQTFALKLTQIIDKIWKDPRLTADQRIAIICFLGGIGSHLALDATTPKGLPFLS